MAVAAFPRLAGDTWSGWSLTRSVELLVHPLHGGQFFRTSFSPCSLWLGPVHSCFFCLSWVLQAAVLVVTVLSALLGQPGGACSLLEMWGFNRWLAKISAPGQAWQKHLLSPVWPDSNDSLYSVVEMITEQHSTSMQSLLQGNIAQSVSGQGSCYCG